MHIHICTYIHLHKYIYTYLVDPLGHPVLAHELEDGELVLYTRMCMCVHVHVHVPAHELEDPQLLLRVDAHVNVCTRACARMHTGTQALAPKRPSARPGTCTRIRSKFIHNHTRIRAHARVHEIV